MKSYTHQLEFQTQKIFDFLDITDDILKVIKDSQIQNGLLTVQSLHTTCAVFVNENEPLLLQDMESNLKKLVPFDIDYKHDNFEVRTVNICDDECANGHSHCKALYLPTSVTLCISGGELVFGQWQRIFFLELDRSRPRKCHVQIIGE